MHIKQKPGSQEVNSLSFFQKRHVYFSHVADCATAGTLHTAFWQNQSRAVFCRLWSRSHRRDRSAQCDELHMESNLIWSLKAVL